MSKKLHLGCGNVHLEGWINIDFNETPAVDLVEDISTLKSIEDNSATIVYACHVLEHFGLERNTEQPRTIDVLTRWYNILKPGGELYVAVPDLMVVFQGIQNNFYNDFIVQEFIQACFGGQNYKGNTHYNGFTSARLSSILRRVGFTNIDRFEPFVQDTSSMILHGLPISLNIKASKPLNT